MEPRLRIVFVPVPPYQEISKSGTGTDAETEEGRIYSIGIENLCPTSIYDVVVQVVHMEGLTTDGEKVNDLRPFALQLDDTGGSIGLFEPFTVNPGRQGLKLVHVVGKSTRKVGTEIKLFARRPTLPQGNYVFTISVNGQNVTAVDGPTQFHIWIGANQELLFEPLTNS